MKKNFLFLAASAICFAMSCNNPKADIDDRHHGHGGGRDTVNEFISIDTANKMLGSYLTSISNGDTNLRSITIDADEMRSYLSIASVSKIKIMFAHTTSYINAGHVGQNCGYNANDLTVIIAGYDTNSNYVYCQGKVLDLGQPCPTSCPTTGTAAQNTFPIFKQ